MRLLFPADAKTTVAVQLTQLVCVDGDGEVLLRFSDGRTLRWAKELSFSSQIALRGGMADRAAVAPKVIAAYTLERLGQFLRRSRIEEVLRLGIRDGADDDRYRDEFAALARLRRDFETFQEQAVLDTVTIGAVYDLALALDDAKHRVSHIVWNADSRQFVLDPA